MKRFCKARASPKFFLSVFWALCVVVSSVITFCVVVGIIPFEAKYPYSKRDWWIEISLQVLNGYHLNTPLLTAQAINSSCALLSTTKINEHILFIQTRLALSPPAMEMGLLLSQVESILDGRRLKRCLTHLPSRYFCLTFPD